MIPTQAFFDFFKEIDMSMQEIVKRISSIKEILLN